MRFVIMWTVPACQICAQLSSYIYFMYLEQRTLRLPGHGFQLYGFRKKVSMESVTL